MLLAQAEQLGNFVPYVGGPQYAYLLLPLLETLSTVEETVVRDKAVESLCKVGAAMPDRDSCDHFVPIIKVGRGAGAKEAPRARMLTRMAPLRSVSEPATGSPHESQHAGCSPRRTRGARQC